jgi:glucokinase
VVLVDTLVRRSLDHNAPAAVLLECWAAIALEAVSRASTVNLCGVGIAMPGPFDYQHGISQLEHKFASLYGQNLKLALLRLWTSTSLEHQPLHFANDAALFALGETWAGAARGQPRVIGITLGTGLGSGFIEHKRIITEGIEIPPKGELWNVPYKNGIAEDFASGRALERLGHNASDLAAIARNGDLEAQTAFADLGQHLGTMLEPWLRSFQPDAVVIGGNVARAWDLFAEALRQSLPKGTHCIATQHFEQATLLGAAALE